MIFRYLFYKCEQPQNTRWSIPFTRTCAIYYLFVARGTWGRRKREATDLSLSRKPRNLRDVVVNP